MKTIKTFFVMSLLFCLLCSLTACSFSHYNPYNSKIIKAVFSNGYYLDDTGVLHCLWANSDASEYVKYINREEDIVATNVKDFGLMGWGGYYISNDNELFMWSKYKQPLYNCAAQQTTKVAANVSEAKVGRNLLCYVDIEGGLYTAGTVGGKEYSISSPLKLADNVTAFDLCMDNIVWVDGNNAFGYYEDNADCHSILEEASKGDFGTKAIRQMLFNEKYLTYLQEGELWFLGDYDSFVSESAEVKPLQKKLISKDVITFDMGTFDSSTDKYNIVYITKDHKAYLCGYYYTNDENTLEQVVTGYLDHVHVMDNVDYCVTGGSFLGFCHCDVSTSSYGPVDWRCGNSYDDKNNDIWIGVYNKNPLTWVEKS